MLRSKLKKLWVIEYFWVLLHVLITIFYDLCSVTFMSSVHVSWCVICPYRKYIYVVCCCVHIVCAWCPSVVCHGVRVMYHGVHVVCMWCAHCVCVVCICGVSLCVMVCKWCVMVCRRAYFWTHLTSLTVTQEMTSQPLSECGVVLWASFWICCVIWLRLKKNFYF